MQARLFIAVCAGLLAVAYASGARFDVKGTVVQLRPETLSVVVAHEEIPGLMPAMTMAFQVKDDEELAGLSAGSKVEFSFVVGDSMSFAEDFRVVGRAVLPASSTATKTAARTVAAGDPAPVVALVNQDGQPTALVDAEGRWTLMTFIFTRCPVPEFCPRMNGNFVAIQEGLGAALEGKARLLSVTLDPEFDTPALLRQYGIAYGADFSNWEFATGEVAEIDRLTDSFRVFVKQNGVTLDHALCTALIGPDGRVERIWRGNIWKPQEALLALNEAVGETLSAASTASTATQSPNEGM